jgi:hypothetical protein
VAARAAARAGLPWRPALPARYTAFLRLDADACRRRGDGDVLDAGVSAAAAARRLRQLGLPESVLSVLSGATPSTRAIAVCPFHLDPTIRIGEDAAESHAFARASKLVKSDGTTWLGEALRKEFGRQLSKAADGYCPHWPSWVQSFYVNDCSITRYIADASGS